VSKALERSWQTDPEERDGVAFWRAGQIEMMRGNMTNAEKLLSAATTKYGAKLMVKEEEIFHDAGVAAYHNGNVTGAEYYLTAAITINRDFPKALNNLACLHVRDGGD
jgi:Tfp pilus assembly protein PilF